MGRNKAQGVVITSDRVERSPEILEKFSRRARGNSGTPLAAAGWNSRSALEFFSGMGNVN